MNYVKNMMQLMKWGNNNFNRWKNKICTRFFYDQNTLFKNMV